MSWVDFYLGVTVALLLSAPLILLTVLIWARNRRRKGKVWLDVQLPHEVKLKLFKPGDDGWFRTPWGAFLNVENCASTFRGLFDYSRPIVRYNHTDVRPIVYDTEKVAMLDGTVVMQTAATHPWVHPKRVKTMLDTDIANKVYHRSRVELLAIATIGLLVIVLLVVMAK